MRKVRGFALEVEAALHDVRELADLFDQVGKIVSKAKRRVVERHKPRKPRAPKGRVVKGRVIDADES